MTTENRPATRERLLNATVALMRAKGAAATGTKEILDVAGAPRGSFYFHFPEGKDQLVLEALQRAAATTLASLVASLADDQGDLGDQVVAVFNAIETELLAEDYAPGCAVGVTTLESASGSPTFQQAVDHAFGTWATTLTDRLVQRGIPADRAPALADTVIAAMEGATLLSRARRSPLPLRHTAEFLRATIASTLPAGSP